MCLFEDGFRAAAAASLGAPSLTDSTRMRGILLRSRHAGEVARLSADLYCKHPVCRSLFATNWRLLRSQSRQCVPSRGGRRGFPFKGERRWGKHVRKGDIIFRYFCLEIQFLTAYYKTVQKNAPTSLSERFDNLKCV